MSDTPIPGTLEGSSYVTWETAYHKRVEELADMTAERDALFLLLKRQHAADAALYNMSHYCSKEEHERWLEEHFDVHVEIGKVIAAAIIGGRMT